MNSALVLDEQQLMAVAARLAERWMAGQAPLNIYLSGDLGAGKTTFTRGFIRGCGHQGIVKSPTYTLVEPYQVAGRNIYHFDLYRLAEPEELEFTGARDCFEAQAACLVEWPEKAGNLLPVADLECTLTIAGAVRELRMRANTRTGKTMMLQGKPDFSL